jgi:hypothetical protein
VVAEGWKSAAEYLSRRKSCSRVLILKHEDLLLRPDEMSGKITDFLGIPLHLPLEPWTNPCNTRYQEPDPDRWRELLPEHRDILLSMNPLLEKHGYETVP